jgi:hypothetical protein
MLLWVKKVRGNRVGGWHVLRLAAENVVLLWRAAPLKFSSHLANAARLKSDTALFMGQTAKLYCNNKRDIGTHDYQRG